MWAAKQTVAAPSRLACTGDQSAVDGPVQRTAGGRVLTGKMTALSARHPINHKRFCHPNKIMSHFLQDSVLTLAAWMLAAVKWMTTNVGEISSAI